MHTAELCPFCQLDGGFHDEDVHTRTDFVNFPAEKRIIKPTVKLCNCGEPLDEPGAPVCRNPRHPAIQAIPT